ncbi:MAG: prepilin-type N-terminal cleavage/methylation domain-containing protein [Verrucomicrobiaceae bacterium]|nr:MAG: prepilin-type N-terminal cleavage/methylation domain-containing protein [Verrucomicrobiaceae bacterium]
MQLSLGFSALYEALSPGVTDGRIKGSLNSPSMDALQYAPLVPSIRNRGIGNLGFTLLELLAVVAILAVLAALGYPALQKSIQAGHSAKCIGNLRALGAAAQQFANDNNGRILTWGNSTFTPFCPRWIQGLAPILGNTGSEAQWTPAILAEIYKQLACPATPAKYRFGVMTYSANSFTNPGWGWPEMRLQSFEYPSSTVYLVDGYATFSTGEDQDIVDQGWPPPSDWNTIGKFVFFPHQGKCHALFLDWHVESFSKSIPAKKIRP